MSHGTPQLVTMMLATTWIQKQGTKHSAFRELNLAKVSESNHFVKKKCSAGFTLILVKSRPKVLKSNHLQHTQILKIHTNKYK